MNLILCGFKNCGKSTRGRLLAEEKGYTFIDTDHLIEANYQNKLSIPEIYEKYGETEFRRIEKMVIHSLQDIENTVIATGGGSVLDPENVEHLKKLGKLIYLKTDKEILKQRLLNNRLPEFLKNFDAVYDYRTTIYEKIADEIWINGE